MLCEGKGYFSYLTFLTSLRTVWVVLGGAPPEAHSWGGAGALGPICSFCRTAVQDNGLVENSGVSSRHVNWWPVGKCCSQVPFLHRGSSQSGKSYRDANCQKVPQHGQCFQMIYHLSLGHISFYISTICRYIGRYKYK